MRNGAKGVVKRLVVADQLLPAVDKKRRAEFVREIADGNFIRKELRVAIEESGRQAYLRIDCAMETGSPSGSTQTASRMPSPSRCMGGITKRTPFAFSSSKTLSTSSTLKPME